MHIPKGRIDGKRWSVRTNKTGRIYVSDAPFISMFRTRDTPKPYGVRELHPLHVRWMMNCGKRRKKLT